MKIFKAVTTVCCAALMGAAFTAIARADDYNEKTIVTFSGPVEIPAVHLKGWGVLPAGTYVFKLVDSQVRPPYCPDLQRGRKDRLRHDSGDPELSPQSHRQDRDHLQRKTGGRAAGTARVVLSGQKPGVRSSSIRRQRYRDRKIHQHRCSVHAGRDSRGSFGTD